MKNLVVRTLSGLVLAAVVLGAIVWSQWSFGALLAALLVGGMYEFYTLAGKQGNAPQRVVGLVAGIVLFALNLAFVSDDIEILGDARQAFGCGLAFLLLLLPAMFICELYRRGENPASGIGTTIMGICYVALPLSLMCYIPIVGSDTWNPWIMVAYIFIIWAGLALVAAVSGVLGDLVESMFKRAAGVKDSGRLIPGHGGVLDRFDAMLLSAPFVFVYMLFVM